MIVATLEIFFMLRAPHCASSTLSSATADRAACPHDRLLTLHGSRRRQHQRRHARCVQSGWCGRCTSAHLLRRRATETKLSFYVFVCVCHSLSLLSSSSLHSIV